MTAHAPRLPSPLLPRDPGASGDDAAAWVVGEALNTIAQMVLPAWLLRQRWYGAKDAGVPQVTLDRAIPFPIGSRPAVLASWRVEPPGRVPQHYFIPLAVLPPGDRPESDPTVLAGAHPDQGGWLVVDAVADDGFIRALVAGMTGGTGDAALRGGWTGVAEAVPLTRPDTPVSRGGGEQSNSSLRIGQDAILKLFRRLEPGMQPELEMGRFLTERARFAATPALLGWADLDGDANGGPTTVAVLQQFIPNEGDGWSWVLERLAGPAPDADGRALAWIAGLGRRTAELHQALAGDATDPDFRPEPVGTADLTAWREGVRAMADRALAGLAGGTLPPAARDAAERLLDQRGALMDLIDGLPATAPVVRTRHHGDFHLGQVLVTQGAEDAVIVDFEGEPLRPLAERRAKHSPLRDVAGMLRSLDYAAAVVARQQRAADGARLADWAERAQRAFLDSYLDATVGAPFRAPDRGVTERLIRFFTLEKALYEVVYELENRPDWVGIPLDGVLALLEGAGAPVARAHRMPFGAEVLPDGRVRFRLWAPRHACLRVEIDGAEPEPVPMTARDEGWHELVTDRAGPGSRYRFVLPDGMKVPDPASRYQPEDVHGPSEVVDPTAHAWLDGDWRGRPWEEAVVYELHIGSFTEAGTFRAAIERLDHLAALGVTVLEIMPVADFPGGRNWGYDGVLPFAPDSAYGRPGDFKALVDAAHARGIAVLLDVVYNHFGPEGNYLPLLCPIFNEAHHTPWGAAVNVDGDGSAAVREFIVHNALYWIEEFHLDGLRLDAVHAIMDDSPRHLLDELAERVRAAAPDRHIHLLLENEENEARRLERGPDGRPVHYSAQWNDDVHHGLHVFATGESAGYYSEYHGDVEKLARALAEGFAFQGEVMAYRGHARGEPSGHLPPGAFVAFLQNHDQVGNRAFGDRITATAPEAAVKAAASLYLLGPQTPMIFMGEEWGAAQPFPFFCEFGPDLADAVREGRRKEFARFPEFADPQARERIPDPMDDATFRSAKLGWDDRDKPPHAAWLEFYRRTLSCRHAEIVPRLRGMEGGGSYRLIGPAGFVVRWRLGDGSDLLVAANLSDQPADGFPTAEGRVIWTTGSADQGPTLGPWSVRWSLEEGAGKRSALDRLAERCGIEPRFTNAKGEEVTTTPETARRLLAAMGIQVSDEADAAAALAEMDRVEWSTPLPPVVVVRAGRKAAVDMILPAGTGEVSWHIMLEDGDSRTGRTGIGSLPRMGHRDMAAGERLEHRRLPLPVDLPPGYHRLSLPDGSACRLIVAPDRCWLPDAIRQGERLWGISAQLYLLRSDRNWGIGDFTDLAALSRLATDRGADVVGVNPLHALFPDNPAHASPYSPASRLLLNILNIDVTALPEFADCAEAQQIHGSPEMQRRLAVVQAADLVAYEEVADLKMQVLGALFHACRSASTDRWAAFERFREAQTEDWRLSCLFLALRQHFVDAGAGPDWQHWPAEFREARGAAVRRFADSHGDAVTFMEWLQWIADSQLAEAAAAGRAAGMRIGLYRDLAVGADRAGAETWVDPQAVVSGAQAGAPPDIFNPAGQAWGLPPFNPRALRAEGYRSFIELVRANMRHAGGLRIDHVMALQHLYWVPDGAKATEGAYVAYPMEDLIGILALESHRNRCLVVGEDLGTVPEGFRERMAEADILSYRVLFFEQEGKTGAFAPPDAYPAGALAVAGSHDLPTLDGWWQGNDIPLKDRLGLYPTEGETDRQYRTRERDRSQLLAALSGARLLEAGEEPDEHQLAVAAHRYLARTPAALAMVQIDDLTGEVDPVNIPATSHEHPNWRRRLSVPLEQLAATPRFQAVCDAIHHARRQGI